MNVKEKKKYLEKVDLAYDIYSYKGRMAPDVSAIRNKCRSFSSILYANLNLFLMTGAERGNEPVLRSPSRLVFKSERYLLQNTIKRKKCLTG